MLCRTRFPKSIISIGWTTTSPEGQIKTGYTREMVDHMASLVREYNLMQPLTFPVNATILKYSICEVQRLLFQVIENPPFKNIFLFQFVLFLKGSKQHTNSMGPSGRIRQQQFDIARSVDHTKSLFRQFSFLRYAF